MVRDGYGHGHALYCHLIFQKRTRQHRVSRTKHVSILSRLLSSDARWALAIQEDDQLARKRSAGGQSREREVYELSFGPRTDFFVRSVSDSSTMLCSRLLLGISRQQCSELPWAAEICILRLHRSKPGVRRRKTLTAGLPVAGVWLPGR